MDENLDKTSEYKPKRDEKGRLLPGQTANPNGRPKGSISIKDEIRKHLEANPEEVQEIVKHFVKENRELMWTMLEGSPKSTSEVKSQHVEISLTGEQALLAQSFIDEQKRRTISEGVNRTDSDTMGGSTQD